jgi:hypothetical protein
MYRKLGRSSPAAFDPSIKALAQMPVFTRDVLACFLPRDALSSRSSELRARELILRRNRSQHNDWELAIGPQSLMYTFGE